MGIHNFIPHKTSPKWETDGLLVFDVQQQVIDNTAVIDDK